MEDKAAPTSILELLTHANPNVWHPRPNSRTNTRNLNYYFPKKLEYWKEFDDIKCLGAVYGGDLLHEACRKDRVLPSYPTIHPRTDCELTDEKSTESLINKWNKTIISTALDPIQEKFHPLIWRAGDKVVPKKELDLPPKRGVKQSQPPRHCTTRVKKSRKRSLSRLKSDSGSVSCSFPLPDDDSAPVLPRRERFPKEYKTGSKWSSEMVFKLDLLKENGEWEDSRENDNYAMPIRQAYTYCIQHMCRYGCILTGKEAFIFRVRPIDKSPSDDVQNTEDDVMNGLITNGLMEYVSVPWSRHCQRDVVSPARWTVNLALWFMHVLAGDHSEAGRNYGALKEVGLAVSPSSNAVHGDGEEERSDSAESWVSCTTPPLDVSPIIHKRKRALSDDEDDDEDGYNLSFSKRRSFTS